MAVVEDAASVLDRFVHDSANLPDELRHLMEEIEYKERKIQECCTTIDKHDKNIQGFVKVTGGHVKNPYEDRYQGVILQKMDESLMLQEEKVALSERAQDLVNRNIKRLDRQITHLQNEGSMSLDVPSMLRDTPANMLPPLSASSTGVSTPLNPLSINVATGGSTTIANAGMARMAGLSSSRLSTSTLAGMAPHPLLSANSNAASRTHREVSVSAGSDTKRRRLNPSLSTQPNPSSSLRQSSLNPDTPSSGTPVPGAGGTGRGGSLGPHNRVTNKKSLFKRLAPHHIHARRKAGSTHSTSLRGPLSKKQRRMLAGPHRAGSATATTSSSPSSSRSSTPDAASSARLSPGGGAGGGAASDADMADMADGVYEDEGEDSRLYCFCQQVSHGNMVACDNDECELEWFHYECVGLTKEPGGTWLCPNCRKLPKDKVKISKAA